MNRNQRNQVAPPKPINPFKQKTFAESLAENSGVYQKTPTRGWWEDAKSFKESVEADNAKHNQDQETE